MKFAAHVECASCDGEAPMPGLALRAVCPHCQKTLELAAHDWHPLAEAADESSFEPTEGGGPLEHQQPTASGRLCASHHSAPVTCRACSTALPLVEAGTEGHVTCEKCGLETPTFPVPAWLRTDLPTAMQVYGAVRDAEAKPEKDPHPFWIVFQGTPARFAAESSPATLLAALDAASKPPSVPPSARSSAPPSVEASLPSVIVDPLPAASVVPGTPPKREKSLNLWLFVIGFAVVAAITYQCSGEIAKPDQIPDDERIQSVP